jgi:hypothetical protein
MSEEENSQTEESQAEPAAAPPPLFRIFPFLGHGKPIFLLCILSFVFYVNTLENEYALDDSIVIMQNQYVLRGFDGIPSLIREDYFHSFYRRMNAGDQLTGGRYRPLPVISFAIEQEILGTYRSGYYERGEDLNMNGKLDYDQVSYNNSKGEAELSYEFNNYIDKNDDGAVQPEECTHCWDHNGNFAQDPDEDLNQDGVINEIDCHIYGAWLRHFTNIVLYMFCCVALYVLLSRQLLPDRPDLAFLTTLIFLIHPAHSEVVANVKGREDLFCFLFMILCLHQALVFVKEQKPLSLIFSVCCGFLALMSKETAVALLVLLPLTFYFKGVTLPRLRNAFVITLVFLVTVVFMGWIDLNNSDPFAYPLLKYLLIALAFIGLAVLVYRTIRTPSMLVMATFFGVSLVYLALRLSAVNLAPNVPDTEILNNPFLLASDTEKFATKVFILLKYLKLVLFPHPLVSDYSFNSIPYVSLTSFSFILSAIVHLVLLVSGMWLTKKRHVAGYGILIYLLFMLLVSNLIFDTHIIMLEAYLFHASMGASLAIAWLLILVYERTCVRKPTIVRRAFYSFLILIILLGGIKAWERSADWKNDVTLFLKDVKQAPNSVLVLGNAGARWIDLADTREITGYSMPGEENLPLNDYNGQLRIDEDEWTNTVYTNKKEAAIYKGIGYLKRAVNLHPRYVNGYLNLGLAYYKLGIYDSTILYWKMAQYFYPSNPYLDNYYQVYKNTLLEKSSEARVEGQYEKALSMSQRVLVIYPGDKDAWMSMAATYYNMNNKAAAKGLLKRVIKKYPQEEDARKLLDQIGV